MIIISAVLSDYLNKNNISLSRKSQVYKYFEFILHFTSTLTGNSYVKTAKILTKEKFFTNMLYSNYFHTLTTELYENGIFRTISVIDTDQMKEICDAVWKLIEADSLTDKIKSKNIGHDENYEKSFEAIVKYLQEYKQLVKILRKYLPENNNDTIVFINKLASKKF